jgi:hypothetical protein
VVHWVVLRVRWCSLISFSGASYRRWAMLSSFGGGVNRLGWVSVAIVVAGGKGRTWGQGRRVLVGEGKMGENETRVNHFFFICLKLKILLYHVFFLDDMAYFLPKEIQVVNQLLSNSFEVEKIRIFLLVPFWTY